MTSAFPRMLIGQLGGDSATYYSPPSSRRNTKWLPPSNKVTLKQVKLLFGPLVMQLVWYMLKPLFTSVSVKVVDIYLHFVE